MSYLFSFVQRISRCTQERMRWEWKLVPEKKVKHYQLKSSEQRTNKATKQTFDSFILALELFGSFFALFCLLFLFYSLFLSHTLTFLESKVYYYNLFSYVARARREESGWLQKGEKRTESKTIGKWTFSLVHFLRPTHLFAIVCRFLYIFISLVLLSRNCIASSISLFVYVPRTNKWDNWRRSLFVQRETNRI